MTLQNGKMDTYQNERLLRSLKLEKWQKNNS